jgi:hypothetical protein
MNAPPKHREPRAGGSQREAGQIDRLPAQSKAGRPEAQGNRIQRSRSQAAPTWFAPRGWHAAELLERCMAKRGAK